MVVYYAAPSIDGRIGGPEHELEFLQTLTGAGKNYLDFYGDVLTVAPTLLGRGPALANGDFPLRRFHLTRLERFRGRRGATALKTDRRGRRRCWRS